MTKPLLIGVGYAIRHIPTGHWLPLAGTEGRGGPGFTYVEPTPLTDKLPRLFKSHSNASKALSSWLKGRFMPKFHKVDYGTFTCMEQCGHKYLPVPGRKTSEMEIVPIQLVPIEPKQLKLL